MKKKSTSQSAFFNVRVLIGLFIALAGVSLALLATAKPSGLGFGASSHARSTQAQQKYQIPNKAHYINPLVPPGFDCSKIHELGIDRMENFRAGAIMIFCGEAKGGKPSPAHALAHLVQKLLPQPLAYGGTDVNLITGTETPPNIIQSETFSTANPDNPDQIVVAYNDSRGVNATPINVSGASVSTDGGITFTRLTRANGQSPFDNTFGDPVILVQQAVPNLVHGLARWQRGLYTGRLQVHHSMRSEIAGLISAFTLAVSTIASLAGRIITQPLPTSGTCTFPGTTLMLPMRTSSSVAPLTTA